MRRFQYSVRVVGLVGLVGLLVACGESPHYLDLDASAGDDSSVPVPDADHDAAIDASPDGGAACVSRVVFSDGRQPDTEILLVNANGTGMVNLSDDVAADTNPSTGPGGRVVFASTRSGNSDIYAVDLDGGNLTNLTSNAAIENTPVVSPDGGLVAFLRGGGLYVMNVDGSNVHAVATGTAYKVSWNSQSTRLAFELTSGSNTDVWVVDAAGTNLEQLTTDPAYDGSTTWSPDGSKIAFVSQRSGSDIFVMNVDGSGVTNLTQDAAVDATPAWSPDGETLAYSSDGDIMLTSAIGGTKTPLTTSSVNEYVPRWSPDGAYVLFRYDEGQYRRLGWVPATGGDVNTITGPAGYSDVGSWVPCQQ